MTIQRRVKRFSEEERELMNNQMETLAKEVEEQMEEMMKVESEIIQFMLENNISSLKLDDGTVVTLEMEG